MWEMEHQTQEAAVSEEGMGQFQGEEGSQEKERQEQELVSVSGFSDWGLVPPHILASQL